MMNSPSEVDEKQLSSAYRSGKNKVLFYTKTPAASTDVILLAMLFGILLITILSVEIISALIRAFISTPPLDFH